MNYESIKLQLLAFGWSIARRFSLKQDLVISVRTNILCCMSSWHSVWQANIWCRWNQIITLDLETQRTFSTELKEYGTILTPHLQLSGLNGNEMVIVVMSVHGSHLPWS